MKLEIPPMAILQARPTIRDIGRKTGFRTYSTVSLALRDHPRISDSTKQIIREAAKKLRYKPDAMLNALCAYRLHETSTNGTDRDRMDHEPPRANRLENVRLYKRLFRRRVATCKGARLSIGNAMAL